jgi:hypothetical protein
MSRINCKKSILAIVGRRFVNNRFPQPSGSRRSLNLGARGSKRRVAPV